MRGWRRIRPSRLLAALWAWPAVGRAPRKQPTAHRFVTHHTPGGYVGFGARVGGDLRRLIDIVEQRWLERRHEVNPTMWTPTGKTPPRAGISNLHPSSRLASRAAWSSTIRGPMTSSRASPSITLGRL